MNNRSTGNNPKGGRTQNKNRAGKPGMGKPNTRNQQSGNKFAADKPAAKKYANGGVLGDKSPAGKSPTKNSTTQNRFGDKPAIGKYAAGKYATGKPEVDKPVFRRPSKDEYLCYSINLHEFLKGKGLKTIAEIQHPKTRRTAFVYRKDAVLDRFLNEWSGNRESHPEDAPIERWILKEEKKPVPEKKGIRYKKKK